MLHQHTNQGAILANAPFSITKRMNEMRETGKNKRGCFNGLETNTEKRFILSGIKTELQGFSPTSSTALKSF